MTNSWHPTSGGISTFYRALLREASKRGHQLRFVVPGEQDCVETVEGDAQIYHVAARPALFNPAYRTIYPTQYLFEGTKVQRILALERPDLVEISDKYTLSYLGGLLRMRMLPAQDFRPVVVGLSNERMDDNFHSYLRRVPLGRHFCSWYMHRIYFPFFDHHIANSAYTAEELQAASRGHLVQRGTWIRHMGVDLSAFSPANRSPEGRSRVLQLCRANADTTLLLYAGRLVPEKNLSLLFELMEHLTQTMPDRRVHLIIAGEGIDRAHWEHYAAKHLPGRVAFLGHISDHKMLATLLANADVFVHPNPREPFGIAPLEAMASGTPLVAPNAGGVTSYAHRGNAWVVPATAAEFSDAIQEILGNRELVRRKTTMALETAESYGWENVAARFLDLYQELYDTFHGHPAKLEADFYSTEAKPGSALLLHWASQAAQRMFGLMVRSRGVSQSDKTDTLAVSASGPPEAGRPQPGA